MSKLGFYNYDDAVVGSDGVIFKDDLTSLPAEAVELGGGTFEYTSAGFVGTPTTALSFTGLTGQADLIVEGTMRVMVSKECFDSQFEPAAAQNFLPFLGGTRFDTNKISSGGDYHYIRYICWISF